MPSLLTTSAPHVTLGLGLSLRVNVVGAAVAVAASSFPVAVAAAVGGVVVIVVVTDALLLFTCCTMVSAIFACCTLEWRVLEKLRQEAGKTDSVQLYCLYIHRNVFLDVSLWLMTRVSQMRIKIYIVYFLAKREIFCELLVTYVSFATTSAGYILVFAKMHIKDSLVLSMPASPQRSRRMWHIVVACCVHCTRRIVSGGVFHKTHVYNTPADTTVELPNTFIAFLEKNLHRCLLRPVSWLGSIAAIFFHSGVGFNRVGWLV